MSQKLLSPLIKTLVSAMDIYESFTCSDFHAVVLNLLLIFFSFSRKNKLFHLTCIESLLAPLLHPLH